MLPRHSYFIHTSDLFFFEQKKKSSMYSQTSNSDFTLSKVCPYYRGKTVYFNTCHSGDGKLKVQCTHYSQGMKVPFNPHNQLDDEPSKTEWQSLKLATLDMDFVTWIQELEANVKRKLVEDEVPMLSNNNSFTMDALEACWSSSIKESDYGGYLLRCKWHTIGGSDSQTAIDLCSALPNGKVHIQPGEYTDVRQGHVVVPVLRAKCVWYVSGKCGIRFDVVCLMVKNWRRDGDDRPTLSSWDGPEIEQCETVTGSTIRHETHLTADHKIHTPAEHGLAELTTSPETYKLAASSPSEHGRRETLAEEDNRAPKRRCVRDEAELTTSCILPVM